ELPEPFADSPFRALITLPLIFDLEPRPLLGIERLQIGPAEYAVRRPLRHEQGGIRPANLGFLLFHDRWRDRSSGRLGPGCRRTTGEGTKQRQSQYDAVRDPRGHRKTVMHRLVGPRR